MKGELTYVKRNMFAILKIGIFTFLCFSCNNKERQSSPHVNIDTPELKKVIEHYKKYPDGNLYLKAAYFLIENIENKYSINEDYFFPYKDTILKYKANPALLELKLNTMKGIGFPGSYPDLSNINSEYLINNINLAFGMYNRSSWNDEINFEMFCEYILPYRIEKEILVNWRKDVMTEENDSISENSSMLEAAKYYIEILSKNKENYVLRWGNRNPNPPDLTYNVLKHLPVGSCKELNDYTAFFLRGLGIPCAIDFTPQYANFNVGHSWSSIILNENKCIPFVIPVEDTLGYYMAKHFRLAKVYRNVYAKKNNEIATKIGDINRIPSFLKEPNIIDVTDQYIPTADIMIDVSERKFGKPDVSFLALFYKFTWKPIAVGERKKGKAYFRKLGLETVFLPVSVNKFKTKIEGLPFYIDKNKSIVELKPNKDSLITLNVLRKYPLQTHITEYINRMIGGVFEGANKPDFSDAETLYSIDQSPGQYYNNIEIEKKNKYRYVRYMGPSGSGCNIAELSFYGNDENSSLSGEIIAYGEPYDTSVTKEKVFDQNEISFYDVKNDSAWVGIDFGVQREISKIRFIARTDYNIIVEGNLYEMFYWDNEWVSLGQKVATNNILTYRDVPSECVYFVKNLTEGVEERIFTYKNDKQVWR